MPAEEKPNGFRRYFTIVAAGVTTALILGSITTAAFVWADSRMLDRDVTSNKELIRACCEQGGETRSDLRDLTTRFDAFLNNLEALLHASEKRLQRLENLTHRDQK
jgi:hypothetical protein